MPSKKKKVEPVLSDEEVQTIEAMHAHPDAETIGKKMADKVDELVTKITKCGHVNKQHYGASGRLEDLACTADKGHLGDHSAKYTKLTGEPVTDEKGRVTKTDYTEEEALATWSDAAGKPAQAQEQSGTQMSLLQKDLVMQILSKTPAMPVEQAIAQAKASPEWNAAERS